MENVEGEVDRSERMDKGRDGEQGRREGHAPGHVLGSRAWTEKDHGIPAAKGTFPLSCFGSHLALQGFFRSIPSHPKHHTEPTWKTCLQNKSWHQQDELPSSALTTEPVICDYSYNYQPPSNWQNSFFHPRITHQSGASGNCYTVSFHICLP